MTSRDQAEQPSHIEAAQHCRLQSRIAARVQSVGFLAIYSFSVEYCFLQCIQEAFVLTQICLNAIQVASMERMAANYESQKLETELRFESTKTAKSEPFSQQYRISISHIIHTAGKHGRTTRGASQHQHANILLLLTPSDSVGRSMYSSRCASYVQFALSPV